MNQQWGLKQRAMRIEAKGQPNQWMNTSSANWWLNRPRVQQRCRSWWVASAIMHCTFGPSNRSGPQWALSGPPLRSCYIHPENSANLHFQYISGNPCITVEIGTPPWLENWGALILCGSSLSDAMKNPRRSWWGGTGEDGELDGGNKLDIWPKDWDFTQMNGKKMSFILGGTKLLIAIASWSIWCLHMSREPTRRSHRTCHPHAETDHIDFSTFGFGISSE